MKTIRRKVWKRKPKYGNCSQLLFSFSLFLLQVTFTSKLNKTQTNVTALVCRGGRKGSQICQASLRMGKQEARRWQMSWGCHRVLWSGPGRRSVVIGCDIPWDSKGGVPSQWPSCWEMYTFGWVDFSDKCPVSKQGCPVFKNNCFIEPLLCPSTTSLSLLLRQPYEVGNITSLILQTWKLRLKEWCTNQLALNLNFSPGCLTLKTVLLTTASKVFWVIAELNVLGVLGHCLGPLPLGGTDSHTWQGSRFPSVSHSPNS